MKEVLEFLEKRLQFLSGFDEEEDLEEILDGEDTFNRGVEEGQYKEAVFLRDKIKKMAKYTGI